MWGTAELRQVGAASISSQHPPSESRKQPQRGQCRAVRASQEQSDPDTGSDRPSRATRRDTILASVNFAVLGSTVNAPDIRTAVNSILGAYGLPRLKDTPGFRFYDNYDDGIGFEYPKAWISRSNRQRKGLYMSDFNTADEATLEIFDMPESADLATVVVSKHSNPASEIGGDGRLMLPPKNKIQSQREQIDGQDYLYLSYPTETVTRSGYQIRRKNYTVAAVRQGVVYTLNASSRSDQINKEKTATLQHIVESFRLRA